MIWESVISRDHQLWLPNDCDYVHELSLGMVEAAIQVPYGTGIAAERLVMEYRLDRWLPDYKLCERSLCFSLLGW